MKTYIRFFIFAGILPVSLSYMVYFGFVSNISGDVFWEGGFSNIHDQGIFKYRILGAGLLRFLYHLVLTLNLPSYAPEVLVRAFPNLSPAFYSAFFLYEYNVTFANEPWYFFSLLVKQTN